MSALMPVLSNNTSWEVIDNAMHKLGIHCGFPQGAMHEHITTQYQPLADLLEKLHPNLKSSLELELETIEDEEDKDWKIHQLWYSKRQWKGSFWIVSILKNIQTNRCRLGLIQRNPSFSRYKVMVTTGMMRSAYSNAGAELVARSRLFLELSKTQQDCYTTMDSFVEKGRSGVHYLLRKNRPTLAIREDANGNENILCALCLHPVAYYTDTWAGVLPPSDELLTHLLMIRDSEKFYWRKANHIPIDNELSGV